MATSLTLTKNVLEMPRGASRTLELSVKDDNGDIVKINGARVVMSVRHKSLDEFPLIVKDSNDATESVITDANAGTAEIYLKPVDTFSLDTDMEYLYDVWVILSSGDRHQVIPPSKFVVKESVSSIPL